MKKTRMRKPEEVQSKDLTLDSLYYTPQDLYVGAIVEFNKHVFLLTSADEYVYSYMERPSEVETFPQSNLRIIVDEVVNCVREKVNLILRLDIIIGSTILPFLIRNRNLNHYFNLHICQSFPLACSLQRALHFSISSRQ